jgi:hypothetical protein
MTVVVTEYRKRVVGVNINCAYVNYLGSAKVPVTRHWLLTEKPQVRC